MGVVAEVEIFEIVSASVEWDPAEDIVILARF